jgi:hypothetical protein
MQMPRMVVIGAVCAVVGAAAGIAGSVASSSHGHPAGRHHGPLVGLPFHGGPFGGGPVHVQAVVPNRAGTGFQTVTIDSGAFKALSGDQLTITEGTKSVTYKTVTLTIPSAATIRRNGASANLSGLKPGDRVHVLQLPGGTFVMAADAQHQARPGELHRRFRGGWRGFGRRGFGPPGGPPPGF